MSNLTNEKLKLIYPDSTQKNRDKYIAFLNYYMDSYEINSPIRQQMFLAQIGHESGQLIYNKELASGKAYDTGKLAVNLGNTPEEDGDGQKYKGRGFIQITGLDNYKKISKAFEVDFINNPDLLAQPEWCVKSACWWWKEHGLNQIADSGDFNKVTRRINGGYNGLEDRMRLYELCKKHID